MVCIAILNEMVAEACNRCGLFNAIHMLEYKDQFTETEHYELERVDKELMDILTAADYQCHKGKYFSWLPASPSILAP